MSLRKYEDYVRDTVKKDSRLFKPDGTPRKLLDVTRLNDLGWEAQISLEEGIKDTYQWFKENY